MFRCITPAPPRRAISKARLHSVTVSIGEETNGTLRLIRFVRFVVRSISLGSTSLLPGRRMKSLNVKTLWAELSFERKLFDKVQDLAGIEISLRYNNARLSRI